MVLAMPAYGMTANPLDQLAVHEFENQNYLFSDIHARGKYPNYIKRYFKENGIKIQFAPGDEEILKNTVDFISFSYICLWQPPTIQKTIRLVKEILWVVLKIPTLRNLSGVGLSIQSVSFSFE